MVSTKKRLFLLKLCFLLCLLFLPPRQCWSHTHTHTLKKRKEKKLGLKIGPMFQTHLCFILWVGKNNDRIEMTTNNSDLLGEIKDISNIYLTSNVITYTKVSNTTTICVSMTKKNFSKMFAIKLQNILN